MYERLETTSDHQTANRIIRDAYQRSKKAYQRLDDAYQSRQQAASSSSYNQSQHAKSSRDQFNASLNIDVEAGFDLGLFGGKSKTSSDVSYSRDRQSSESRRTGRSDASQNQSDDATRTISGSNSAEDRITKGYFADAEALRAYQAKTTEQKQPKVRIIGRGLNVIEKAQFEQNINAMASFVFVQPMTQAKSFMTDARIATYAKNDVPSALETLRKAAALTDAVRILEDGTQAIISVNGKDILEVSRTLSNHKGTYQRNLKLLGPSDGSKELGKTSLYGGMAL
ncbi:hypothetical protein TI05_13965, partial [Achromatium sp. WMS3]